MRKSLIVAMTEDRVIGRAGGLPWRLSSDLKRFKRLTMGHTIIMGRKTYESIGRLLPGRKTVIISRNPQFAIDGATVATSVDDAFSQAEGSDEAFIVGGAAIYAAALPIVERLYVTLVKKESEGDTFFPQFEWSDWRLVEEEQIPAGDRDEYPTTFRIYDRLSA